MSSIWRMGRREFRLPNADEAAQFVRELALLLIP